MEGNKGVLENKWKDEVVLTISRTGVESETEGSWSFSNTAQSGSSPKSKVELTQSQKLQPGVQTSNLSRSPSHEYMKNSPSSSPCLTPNSSRPPKIPTDALIRRFSKPKSRLVESPYPSVDLAEEKARLKNVSVNVNASSPKVASPFHGSSPAKDKNKSAPITPRTPLISSVDGEEEDDDEVYKTANMKVQEVSGKKFKRKAIVNLIEWAVFVCLTGFLVASLTVHKLQDALIWGLNLWKWTLFILVILCGRLVTEWLIKILVFLIEMNFLLKKKVLYFVFGLKKSVQAFIWLSMILLAWALLINRGVKRSRNTMNILHHVTKALGGFLIGTGLWLIKTLLVKLLSSSFQCTRFFDRIQESIFHQYIVRTLSGPPIMEMEERVGRSQTSGRLSLRKVNKGTAGKQEEVIDVDRLHRIRQDKVSAWTMKGLINVISQSGLSTLADALDRTVDEEDSEQKDKEITSEVEAKAAAYKIFTNVAKSGSKHIDEDDLLRFMRREDVDSVLLLFPGAAESKRIKRSSLKNWLVSVYNERKVLAHALNDTKTAIEELNKLASVIVIIIGLIVWLLMMGFLTTNILLFISSQLLLVAFMFGNTAKTVFEAIIFVFVMHPFDVGDRCLVDGVQMIVEEVNILTTIFLKYDNEKIFYPNSVLATKPISNFYRSPEMGDSVEFDIDFSTSADKIATLKAKIKTYLESKSQHWRPNHAVVVKDIENVDKLKMALYMNHTINFQNYGDKTSRRSELVLQLKKILEELEIKYHLLPQEVHVTHVGSATAAALAAR